MVAERHHTKQDSSAGQPYLPAYLTVKDVVWHFSLIFCRSKVGFTELFYEKITILLFIPIYLSSQEVLFEMFAGKDIPGWKETVSCMTGKVGKTNMILLHGSMSESSHEHP